jgi:Fur family ferric uptake transcriptional regulator
MAPWTLTDALDAAGYRLTRPRRQVAELIADRDDHFTASDLMADARRRGMAIGRATVFRSLEKLSALGQLERVRLPTGEQAYVACRPPDAHHHHVVCGRCGRSVEVAGCTIGSMTDEIRRRTGYDVATHHVELFGTCPECLASGADPIPPSGHVS